MSIVERNITEIDLRELTKVDAHFGRHAEVNMDAIPKRQEPVIQGTRERCFENFRIRSVYESFPIEKIEENRIYMETGHVLESSSLAKAFAKSKEIVLMVISLSGHDEVDASYKRITEKYFVDSWATAMVASAANLIRTKLYQELNEKGWEGTFSWSPGQHNLSMENQRPLFDMLYPEEIGVTLNDSYLMIPQKTESLFFGVGREKEPKGMRPCDFCDLRETCPSAYSDQV